MEACLSIYDVRRWIQPWINTCVNTYYGRMWVNVVGHAKTHHDYFIHFINSDRCKICEQKMHAVKGSLLEGRQHYRKNPNGLGLSNYCNDTRMSHTHRDFKETRPGSVQQAVSEDFFIRLHN